MGAFAFMRHTALCFLLFWQNAHALQILFNTKCYDSVQRCFGWQQEDIYRDTRTVCTCVPDAVVAASQCGTMRIVTAQQVYATYLDAEEGEAMFFAAPLNFTHEAPFNGTSSAASLNDTEATSSYYADLLEEERLQRQLPLPTYWSHTDSWSGAHESQHVPRYTDHVYIPDNVTVIVDIPQNHTDELIEHYDANGVPYVHTVASKVTLGDGAVLRFEADAVLEFTVSTPALSASPHFCSSHAADVLYSARIALANDDARTAEPLLRHVCAMDKDTVGGALHAAHRSACMLLRFARSGAVDYLGRRSNAMEPLAWTEYSDVISGFLGVAQYYHDAYDTVVQTLQLRETVDDGIERLSAELGAAERSLLQRYVQGEQTVLGELDAAKIELFDRVVQGELNVRDALELTHDELRAQIEQQSVDVLDAISSSSDTIVQQLETSTQAVRADIADTQQAVSDAHAQTTSALQQLDEHVAKVEQQAINNGEAIRDTFDAVKSNHKLIKSVKKSVKKNTAKLRKINKRVIGNRKAIEAVGDDVINVQSKVTRLHYSVSRVRDDVDQILDEIDDVQTQLDDQDEAMQSIAADVLDLETAQASAALMADINAKRSQVQHEFLKHYLAVRDRDSVDQNNDEYFDEGEATQVAAAHGGGFEDAEAELFYGMGTIPQLGQFAIDLDQENSGRRKRSLIGWAEQLPGSCFGTFNPVKCMDCETLTNDAAKIERIAKLKNIKYTKEKWELLFVARDEHAGVCCAEQYVFSVCASSYYQ